VFDVGNKDLTSLVVPKTSKNREINSMVAGFKAKQEKFVDYSQTENTEPSNRDCTNPFDFIYQSNDVERSNNLAIVETYDYVFDLSEEIEGDYDLERRLKDIEFDHLAYIRIGANYKKAQVLNLHKKNGFDNFKDFCPQYFGKCYTYVRKLQEASRVGTELIMAGFNFLPQNASQAYELRHYTGNELIDKWQHLINYLPVHQITQDAIKNLIGKPASIRKTKDCRITLPIKTHLLLETFAEEKNTSIADVIDYLLRYTIACLPKKKDQEVSKKQIEIWEEDLQDLVDHYQETQVDFKDNA